MQNLDNSQTVELVANLVIKLSPELFSLLKEIIATNHKVESQLRIIDKKLDNLILREIQSAFQIIDSLACVESESMKDRHLIEAERSLLKNISLDLTLTTAGKNNSYWSAQSLYGLSLIALLRKENLDATRFLLQTFLVCPSEARKTLAKKLYIEKIEPQCESLKKEYETELRKIPDYNKESRRLRGEIMKNRIAQVAMGGLVIASKALQTSVKSRNIVIPDSVFQPAVQHIKTANGEVDDMKRELEDIPTEKLLKSKYEKALDEKCKEIAKEILGKRDF
jgi:hypothetical protein